MDTDCSLLINSCDKFKDAWWPYFALLKKNWPDCPYRCYLNTEKLTCNIDGVTTLNSSSTSWSGRLLDALNKIDSDFVLISLEDFFLMDKVKGDEISKIIEVIKKDKNIAVVYPKLVTGYSLRDSIHPEWIRMDYSSHRKYIINCQFGIWNKTALKQLIVPGLTPWQLEREYVLSDDNKYKFYCIPKGTKHSYKGDIFPYFFAIEKGYGITRSKWLWNNSHLFRKENINVDMKKLGVISYSDYIFSKMKSKCNNIKRSIKVFFKRFVQKEIN